MKKKDVLWMATTALGTAALIVALFRDTPMEADVDAQRVGPPVDKPTLLSNGIELTLAPVAGRSLKAGDQPVFELRALNTTNAPGCASVVITMNASPPEARLSRTPRLPKILWQDEESFTLKAGESKVVTLLTKTELPTNSLVSVMLKEGLASKEISIPRDPAASSAAKATDSRSQAIIAMQISTLPPKSLQTVATR
jgi:hypothetical protein